MASTDSNLQTEEPETSLNEDELREKKEMYLFLTEGDFDEWWSTVHSKKVGRNSYSDHEEDIFKYSMVMKAFRNEYETDSLFPKRAAKLISEGKIDLSKNSNIRSFQNTSLEVLVPGYNPNSFIPNTSSLTFRELKLCWEIIEAGGPKTQEQINFWAEYKVKLEEEQNEYMEIAKGQWVAENFKRHAEIKPEVKELVDLYWKVRIEKVYTYPKFYLTIEDVPLIQISHGEEVQVNFIKTLETIGRPAKYFIPDLWIFNVNVNQVIDKIRLPTVGWSKSIENTCYKDIHPVLISKGYHSDVSKDKIAENLAKENGVNIVMSSSGFSCLLDHFSAENNSTWHLPFTVIEHQTDRGCKKIVLIDKKLAPKTMTIVNRNRYYAKLALKKLLITPPNVVRDTPSLVYDADKLETFGVDSSPKKIPNLKKKRKKKCSYCVKKENNKTAVDDSAMTLSSEMKEDMNKTCAGSDSDDSSRFYIDTDDEGAAEQKTVQDKQQVLQEGEKPAVTENLANKPEADNICCCTYEWVEDKEVSPDKRKKKKLKYQVIYNLWDFNSSASQNYMSKHCSKNLKVIIRTTNEGLVKENDEEILYKLSPKLEYQTEFGAEEVSLNEILKEWASIFIRPTVNLARVRLDGVTGELIQIQRLSNADLAAECQRLHKFNPKDLLASIHSLLVKMSDLPPATYMLSYKHGSGKFVKIAKSVERGGSQVSNLHLLYNRVDPTHLAPQRSPFTPLDPTVITPTYQYFKRVPCTFSPKYGVGRKSRLQDNSAINPPNTKRMLNKKGYAKKKKAKKK